MSQQPQSGNVASNKYPFTVSRGETPDNTPVSIHMLTATDEEIAIRRREQFFNRQSRYFPSPSTF